MAVAVLRWVYACLRRTCTTRWAMESPDLRIRAWSFSIESAPSSVQPLTNSVRENSKGTLALSFHAKMRVVMSSGSILSAVNKASIPSGPILSSTRCENIGLKREREGIVRNQIKTKYSGGKKVHENKEEGRREGE